jgi:uncharacterized protein YbjT (DUF2867 family)
VAEDLIAASGVPYVFVRAPAFLDQSSDYIADGVKAGRFYAVGDKTTKWSYVLTDDLASYLAKAATYPGNEINNQTIDIGWRDGPKSQQEIADTMSDIMKRRLAVWVVPWLIFRLLGEKSSVNFLIQAGMVSLGKRYKNSRGRRFPSQEVVAAIKPFIILRASLLLAEIA